MEVSEKEDEIILRDYPLTNWMHGILFLFGFILFILPVINAAGASSIQTPTIFLIFAFGLAIFSLYWAGQKFFSPVIITRVKLSEPIVTVKSIKFPLRTRTKTYEFSRIKRFETVQRKFDRTYLYFNIMILKDGSHVDLESSGMGIQTNRIPSKLNEILKKHQKSRQNRRI